MDKTTYEAKRDDLLREAYRLEQDLRDTQIALGNLDRRWELDHEARIHREYRLRPEHVTMAKAVAFAYMDFRNLRPFGNSDWRRDLAKVLGWELPNDDLSNEQHERADRLMRELPLALKELLAGIALPHR